MKLLNLDQRTDTWLNWRRQGITATESAVILGLSPYKTPWRLWCEKTKRALEPDLSNNPHVQRGVYYEESARELFEREHTEVVMPMCAEMDATPIFRASFDGLTTNDEPVEIKCPSQKTLSMVREFATESEPYKLYYIQVQHQIMVAGAERGYLIFYDSEKGKNIEFVIERDEAIIQRIYEEGLKFWMEYIVKDIEPAKDAKRDVYIPQGSDLKAWLTNATRWTELNAEVKELQERITELCNEKLQCQKVLTNLMGNHLRADFAGVALTKRVMPGVIKWKDFMSAHHIDMSEAESFRGKPSESWLIRATERFDPVGFVSTEPVGL